MAITSSRPPVALSDAVWALDRLIRQANEEQLGNAAQRYANQVNVWLEIVRPLAERQRAGDEVGPVPEFPLNATELEDLQRAVHEARQARGASGSIRRSLVAQFLYPLEHLRESIRHAQRSSWLIAFGLLALILLNVVDLLIIKDLPRGVVFALNVGATLLVAGAWAFHHFHSLGRQTRSILQHLAIHHLH